MVKNIISIVVPVCNSNKTISKCVESILNQTFTNFELILVNDGSKDNSEEIIFSYKDDRIKYIKKLNGGQSSARNKGLHEATGQYIMFIDSDDYLSENYLQFMYDKCISDNADVVISGYTNVDETYKKLNVVKYKNNGYDCYRMLIPWGKLIKKSILDDNNIEFENINYWEDHVISFAIYSYAKKIVIDESNFGYYYFYNLNGLTKNNFLAFKVNCIPSQEAILKTLNKKDFKDNISFWKFIFVKESICHMLESGRDSNAKKFVERDKEVFDWYKQNISNNLYIKIPKQERFKIKIIVRTYLLLRKMSLIKLFAKMYCKGE